jgi:GxxExxY protein|tara:strand:- start:14592 stop:14990 length:399 start_codon:yes stop_codon:yes gene_type:complete
MFNQIKDSIYSVEKELGNYYKENIYQSALAVELQMKGIIIQTEVVVPILYKNVNVGYERADIVVYNENCIYTIIELKSQNSRISTKEINQLKKYLNNLGCDSGILVNFYDSLEIYLVDKFSHKKICNDTSHQ